MQLFANQKKKKNLGFFNTRLARIFFFFVEVIQNTLFIFTILLYNIPNINVLIFLPLHLK